ncbi:alkaline phosphatase PhoX [Hymenobacter chitinivorans]|uniref:Secretion system C-terminal sorting domain-containing protein n=1 Tax=Hymenobacter chitinivorans DSM 11115 TaxID=1121954 RepID=A0A2M9BT87_9BACT|nr:alkaline phosphatase PhoX [Hymenobacter chitinivorans]PJJ61166.1 hypothetical protein CLV45_2604 [Hymenobacter chitinivorans DSM 11115]
MTPTRTLLAAALLTSLAARAQSPCPTLPPDHISRFTSIQPATQSQELRLPATHTFQLLAQSGMPYSSPAEGNLRESFDFTAYVPINGSSTSGYLSINHEGSSSATSGVSVLNLSFNPATRLWNVTAKNPVNFGPVVGTYNNCSGGLTPWNTVVTCEENTPTAPTDSNNDGYLDFGWTVELDPATRTVKDQDGDGAPDKLWRLGRFRHENVVVAPDRRTVYEGADEGSVNSFVYKYVADAPGQLGNGTLYVLKLNGAIGAATTGTWLAVPNTTPAECNNISATALALGATSFSGVEDVDISPLTGQVYFSAKSPGSVYRFTDGGATVSGFEVFVGNSPGITTRSYPINYGSGTVAEAWATGNDNLTFDSQGNLYVLQDGGRNHVWLVRPCHTQAAPAVELFATTPAGSEPTGMTLSPDEKFMFISLQHPAPANTQSTTDAAGQAVVFNKSSTIVISRKGSLGTVLAADHVQPELAQADVFPNPTTGPELTVALTNSRKEAATLQVFNSLGARVLEQTTVLSPGLNSLRVPVGKLRSGHYTLVVKTTTTTTTRPFIKQ